MVTASLTGNSFASFSLSLSLFLFLYLKFTRYTSGHFLIVTFISLSRLASQGFVTLNSRNRRPLTLFTMEDTIRRLARAERPPSPPGAFVRLIRWISRTRGTFPRVYIYICICILFIRMYMYVYVCIFICIGIYSQRRHTRSSRIRKGANRVVCLVR